jgi:hypothetical protein
MIDFVFLDSEKQSQYYGSWFIVQRHCFVIPVKTGIQTFQIGMDSASKPALSKVERVRNDGSKSIFERVILKNKAKLPQKE